MYYNKEKEEVLEDFNVTLNGLSSDEATKRLEKNGYNVLPTKPRDSIFKLFIKELSSPIELILIFTVIVSFLIGERVDALVITFIILVDVLMGTFQENKALKSAEALNKMLKIQSKVLRDNEEIIIDAKNIVTGDILLLESGDKVSADARIIESTNLQVDESSLTGESVNVAKNNKICNSDAILAERSNMLYAGTSIMTGRAKAVVVATGIKTEIGKIADSVINTEEEKSPLTIRIEKFSKQISLIIIVVAIIFAIVLFLKGYQVRMIFLSVVALAVSAMPEGLPLALTMALTIATNRMGKKGVIVKKLNSVESLGSCTVIASDKTGTLTINEQTAKKIVLKDGREFDISGIGYNVNGEINFSNDKDVSDVSSLASLCALNNEAHFEHVDKGYTYYGDSIDIAFLVLKEKLKAKSEYSVVSRVPYESEKQYSAVFYKKDGKMRCTIKGSIERVMDFSENNKKYIKQNEKLSKEGYRVIAVADGEVESTNIEDIKNLEFLGLVGFIDPIREEALKAIQKCEGAGIKVVMITGDHPLTALAIAKELGLAKSEDDITTGREIDEAYQKGHQYFDDFIKNKRVFSRVTPTNKLHIVESFKRMGDFVAVTGDGVNDAPAIKAANIGIAMGSGTDVAKDASSMIIADDNFKSIVEGVEEGRIAYANIRKIVLFLLSCGMAEVLFYLFSVGFGYELPLLAIQLLWINIVTDGLQDIALSFEVATSDIMKEKPRDPKESLFNKDLMLEVVIFGLTISLMVFGLWKFLNDKNYDLVLARSIILMLMVFVQNIHVLNCRSEKNSVFKTKIFSNPLIVIVIVVSIALQLIITEIPFLANLLNIQYLPINTILIIFMFSVIIIAVAEIYKLIYRNVKKN